MPPQPASQKRYKVTGTVVNSVTGEPIGRAVVRVNGPGSQQVFTDGSGHFEISDVPEGQFWFSAQRPGFLAGEAANHPPPMITVGPATSSIQLKLTPEGVIRGKITNNEGEPVEGVGMQIMRQQINNGRREWMQQGGANTDENGEYQVEGLTPGQYLIRTFVRPLIPMNTATENGPLTDVYPPQYFPNAPSRDSAQPVTVQPGQTAEADFRLSPVPSYSISGVVSGPQNTLVSCENSEGDQIGFSRINHRTSQFKLLHVPAGPCTLTFRAQEGDKTYYAEQPVTVSSANITNVQAALQLLPDIPVHLSETKNGMPVQLELTPRQKHWRGGRFYATMQGGQQEGATPVFKNVPPGSYQVLSQSFNNLCIGAISSGGTDLLRDDLTVVGGNAQAPPIEVSLRNDCATLTGTSNTNSPPSGTSSPGIAFYVLVTSGSADAEPKLVPVWNGQFSLPGFTPGEYTVYTFSDISDLEYANPEALREYSGQKITLSPGEKATVQLNVIKRGDSKQ